MQHKNTHMERPPLPSLSSTPLILSYDSLMFDLRTNAS